MERERIAVVYGGLSHEREISIKSGYNVIASLEKRGSEVVPLDLKRSNIEKLLNIDADLFFLALHGKFGEDGTVQGLLELAGLTYTGSDSEASAICFDKEMTYRLMRGTVHLPEWKKITTPEDISGWEIFPCVLKPTREGSSIGVMICDDLQALMGEASRLIEEYDAILIEEYIAGREVTVSIIDFETGPVVLPILEIRPKKRFYDYEAKYTAGMTDFIVPAPLDITIESQIKSDALNIYRSLGCRDMARIDGIVKGDRFYFLEVNTIPGLTDLSDLPMSARAMGLSFDKTIGAIVEAAGRRNRR